MKIILLLSSFIFLSCNQKKDTPEQTDVRVEESSSGLTELKEDESIPQIGRAIYGDFVMGMVLSNTLI